MIQHTWERIQMLVPPERVMTVLDVGRADTFCHLTDRLRASLIYQPANRDTGPGTLLPLAHVLRAEPEAIVAIFPPDHLLLEEDRFMAHVQIAEWVARRGMWDIVILAVVPDRPDPDYGWIEVRRAGRHPRSCLLPIGRSWERPDSSVAQSLYEGGHLWSTMVTIARAASLWDLICDAEPDLHRHFQRIKHALGTDAEAAEISAAYAEMPSMSLFGGVFQRVPSRLAALAVRDVRWSHRGRDEHVTETSLRPAKARNAVATQTSRSTQDLNDTFTEEEL